MSEQNDIARLNGKDDLFLLRDKLLKEKQNIKVQVLVGVSSCGIAAGALDVLKKFKEIVKQKNLISIEVNQAGCIGKCYIEPTVEIIKDNNRMIVLGNVTPDDVQNVIDMHIINDIPESKYTLSANFKSCFC